MVNDLPLGGAATSAPHGRRPQFFERNGEVCPANWKPGEEGMRPDAKGVASYLAKHG
jgi:peroxiredoxin (alkyl hydroperoxide reductase subunit C)